VVFQFYYICIEHMPHAFMDAVIPLWEVYDNVCRGGKEEHLIHVLICSNLNFYCPYLFLYLQDQHSIYIS